jgi:hypothetical protein
MRCLFVGDLFNESLDAIFRLAAVKNFPRVLSFLFWAAYDFEAVSNYKDTPSKWTPYTVSKAIKSESVQLVYWMFETFELYKHSDYDDNKYFDDWTITEYVISVNNVDVLQSLLAKIPTWWERTCAYDLALLEKWKNKPTTKELMEAFSHVKHIYDNTTPEKRHALSIFPEEIMQQLYSKVVQ